MVKAARDLDRAMPSPGLRAGDSAPDFTLFNAFGRRVKLSDQLKEGPVVLAFYRGAWCPFCNIEMNVLQRSNKDKEMVHFPTRLPARQCRSDGYLFGQVSC